MPKVLVVDDVADNVELLVYALEDHGYEVLKAFDEIGSRLAKLEAVLEGKGCESVKADFSVVPVSDVSDRVVLLLVLGQDVTYRNRAQEALMDLLSRRRCPQQPHLSTGLSGTAGRRG